MKFRIICVLILFISLYAKADQIDFEGLCSLDIESEKIYSSIPEGNLRELISMFESLEKLDDLEEITNHNYQDTVDAIEKHRKVENSEAELIVLEMHKNIELVRMKRAIELRSVDDPEKWENEFNKCVLEGKNMMRGQDD